jgi:hypothetical protein
MSEGMADRIRHLVEAMNRLELQIAGEAEILKDRYIKAAAASYLLTRKGIEVPGEGTVQIPEFIDSVLKFANYPKRKIEVLSDLATHLQSIYVLIGSQEAQ